MSFLCSFPGISELHTCPARCARVFSTETGPVEDEARFDASAVADRVDVFISHSWSAGRWQCLGYRKKVSAKIKIFGFLKNNNELELILETA